MSMIEKWTAVDQYMSDVLIPKDSTLEEVLQENAAANLPAHDVSPTQSKFLQLLVQIQGARNILEIGTLGGYSTIWLARALPYGGRIVTLEASEKHAEIARSNIERANLTDKIEIRVGLALALDSLQQIENEKYEPFDFIFIDADKQNNPAYFEWALKLSRPGTVIIGDNVVREGEVINNTSSDSRVQGIRRFYELIAAEPRVSATALQTVGSKGYDGFVMAVVKE
ncbi:putative O-methyltransferase [Bacillus cereus ATCC 4342]|uniref:O-methyltransferase n=1 Tax=Bacillus tropicus TaxID=2026188 RepID=UPI0001A00BFD|nr:O-methyltransferase [Bacillus tropicus]AJH75964.1 O-methyltransferase, putative [Bacillus cereus ATCC 4342]EEK84612.1 O-methyltransferase family 3 [Bacillus cereus ATCC 4342]KFM85383.1 putative O-methyltransferase [Bacillus cereus ATCC 4342]MDR4456441.1 O-methyltransferase [Bacillus tropicus]QKH58117.1 O-methyltransferase [Bacillus tropicus]